jgi:hypothetical protein
VNSRYQLDVTWGQALKIWWSFTWRSSVLFVLIVFPLEAILMFFLFRNMPQHGQKLDPQQGIRMASRMMMAWPVLMALVIALQAAGMRWMLQKARWSDFRLAILPPER